MKKLFSIMSLLMLALFAKAQDTTGGIEMADVMRSNGKIYVVIAVLLIIFAALITFLVMQEMRLRKLEKKINQNNSN